MDERRCLHCGGFVNQEFHLKRLFCLESKKSFNVCPTCQTHFKIRTPPDCWCVGCGRRLNSQTNDQLHQPFHRDGEIYCYDCVRWLDKVPVEFVRHHVLLDFSSDVKAWIENYKYVGDVRQAQVIVPVLKQAYRFYRHYEWLVLPSQKWSLQQRGFHPVAYLLDQANIPYTIPFEYGGEGKRQAEKTRQERLESDNPFCLLETRLPKSPSYLIFDDVYTTGATLMHAKTCLSPYFERAEILSLSLVGEQHLRN